MKYILAMLAAGSLLFLVGCNDDGAEEVGENIDEAFEEVGDAAEDAADEVKDATN